MDIYQLNIDSIATALGVRPEDVELRYKVGRNGITLQLVIRVAVETGLPHLEVVRVG